MNLAGKINLIKLFVLPKCLYLFQNFPILIKKKHSLTHWRGTYHGQGTFHKCNHLSNAVVLGSYTLSFHMYVTNKCELV